MIAGGASGKAGGLVAKWAYPRKLADITFAEHERLAKEHDGEKRWGWRHVECGQWEGHGDIEHGAGDRNANLSLRKRMGSMVAEDLTDAYEPMADPGSTAQVHPYQFTTSMLKLAQQKGVNLVIGKKLTDHDRIRRRDCCWALDIVTRLLRPISGTRAHSITIRPSRPVSAYAIFTEITLPSSARFTSSTAQPEIYVRPNNEVYARSPGGGEPLPASMKDVKVDVAVCDALFKHVGSISPESRNGEVTAQQACYLPQLKGGPQGCSIVGEVEDAKELVIATGHTCWGICNAPGTGKAISELVMNGKITCGKFNRLAPRMFF